MTLKNPIMNFYDSDFDSRNESSIFDDTSDLFNRAFIASPGKSISCILEDSSLDELAGILVYNDGKELKKVRDQEVNKLSEIRDRVELPCQEDDLKTTDEAFRKTSLESDLKPYPMPGYLCTNGKNWVSVTRRNSKARFCDLASEIGNLQSTEISETADLSKKEERTACVFTSTYLGEFQKSYEEYDSSKTEKRFFGIDDESKKMEPKIKYPVSRYDHVYHELSTIPEVDSVLIDESLMDSDECDSLFTHHSKHQKFLKANDSFDILMKAKASPKFPAYVMKVIQNEHIEKLLQEPGILEESDLTLISTDFDSLSKISERSTSKGHCHSYYKIKRFDEEESPSLISFLEHELSCMRECIDG